MRVNLLIVFFVQRMEHYLHEFWTIPFSIKNTTLDIAWFSKFYMQELFKFPDDRIERSCSSIYKDKRIRIHKVKGAQYFG